jgi:hypothetical protein
MQSTQRRAHAPGMEVMMLRSFSKRWLLVASLVVGALSGVGNVSAQEDETPPSQMYFDVGNPAPGDTVHVGALAIEGIAFDRAADEAPGIERIDVFLGDRDEAGALIGHGTPGAPSPTADDPELANTGWTARVMLTKNMTGQHTMFFYALSGVTGEEMVVAIPVRVVP